MKNIMLGLMLAAAVLAAACGGAADNRSATAEKTPSTPPTKEELVSLDRQAGEAWMRHDTTFFDTFLSDNFIGYGGTRWQDKQGAMSEIAGHKCDIKSFNIEDPVMKMAGNDVAVLTYKGTYDGTCDGKKIPEMRAATAFVRKATLWLAAYHSETPITAAPASGDKKADAKKEPAAKSDANTSKPTADVKKAANAETADKNAGEVKADATKAEETKPLDYAAATTNVKPSADPALTEALLKVEIAGWEAWKAHDAKKLDEITTKDMMYVDSMGTFSPDKASTLKAWAEPCNVSSVSITEAQSASVTAEVGILTYKGTPVGTCGDQKLGPLWGATIFLNEGGNWRMTFMIEKPAV